MSKLTEQARLEVAAAKRGALLFTVGFVGFSIAAAFFFAQFIFRGQSAGPSSPVVVFAQGVEPNDLVKAEAMKVVLWPAESVPEGAFSSVREVLANYERILMQAQKGEPVLRYRLAKPGHAFGIARRLSPETRGFILETSEEVARTAALQPGSTVDIYASFRTDTSTFSVTLLKEIPVLAVGSRYDPSMSEEVENVRKGGSVRERLKKRRVITLMVTPDQAQRLVLAKNEGTIELALHQKTLNHEEFADALQNGPVSKGSEKAATSVDDLESQDATKLKELESEALPHKKEAIQRKAGASDITLRSKAAGSARSGSRTARKASRRRRGGGSSLPNIE